jgi:anti-sigma-K factor RskA
VTREEFEQLSAEYALGSLAGDDLRRLEEYLRTASPGDLREFQELSGAASLLPLALERHAPPPGAKEKLRQKIRLSIAAHEGAEALSADGKESRKVRAPGRLWKTIAWTALPAAAVLGVLVFTLAGRLDQRNGELSASGIRVAELTTQITSLKDELVRKEELLKVLASQKIEITVMNGLKVNPVGFGKIIWDPEKRSAILQVSRLPAVPGNKDYQLWVIKGKTPISAGVFSVNDTTASFFKIDGLAVTDPREISAFAVTLEPKGGLPAPTGDMYLAGSPRL